MIRVRFACGHEAQMDDRVMDRPACHVCGNTTVARTFAPAPRFRGLCSGPSAEMRQVEPHNEKLVP
jgi:hypothetical protein